MKHQHAYLSMLTNNIEDAILFVDVDMKILDINPVACRLLGWEIEDILDKPYCFPGDIAPTSHHVLQGQLQHALNEHNQIPFQQALSARDKITNIVEGTIYPLFDHDQILGVIAIFRVSAPEKEAEKLQADFIAMGTRGNGKVLKTIWGSVTAKVAEKAEVPVWAIPSQCMGRPLLC